jgi:hypothetical protein
MGVFVFSSGIALVLIGIILLIVARRMKPNPDKHKLEEPGPNNEMDHSSAYLKRFERQSEPSGRHKVLDARFIMFVVQDRL